MPPMPSFFFLGIPWEDPDVTMSTKVGLFLHALDVLEVEVQEEAQLSLFYLVMAAMQLFRLLYATKAHPRIAILVKTLIVGLDDLAHFSILFLFLIGGYMALGHSQFGGSRPEFEVCLCVHSSSLLFAQNVPRLLLTTRALKLCTSMEPPFEASCLGSAVCLSGLMPLIPFFPCSSFLFVFRRTSNHPSELCGK